MPAVPLAAVPALPAALPAFMPPLVFPVAAVPALLPGAELELDCAQTTGAISASAITKSPTVLAILIGQPPWVESLTCDWKRRHSIREDRLPLDPLTPDSAVDQQVKSVSRKRVLLASLDCVPAPRSDIESGVAGNLEDTWAAE